MQLTDPKCVFLIGTSVGTYWCGKIVIFIHKGKSLKRTPNVEN